jgi:chaperonin cofactor prefoldin
MASKNLSLASLSFALGDDYKCEDNGRTLITYTEQEHTIYIRSLVEWLFFTGQLICNLPERALSSFAEKNPCIRQWVKMPYMYFVGKTDPNSKTDRGTGYTKNWGGAILHKEFGFPKDINDTQIHPLITMDGVWFVLSGFGGSTEILCSFNFETEEEALDDLVNRMEKIRGEVTQMCDNFFKKHGIRYGEAKKLSDSDKDSYWKRYIFDTELIEKQINHIKDLPKDTCIHVDQDFYGNISEFLLSKGYSNVITEINETCENIDNRVKLLTKEEIDNMNPTVNLSNPPYQAPNLTGKKGKGGNNSLYLNFIEDSIDRAPKGGIVIKITPPSGLIKSTRLHEPTKILDKMIKEGSLEEIDLTVKKYFPSVGSNICSWKWIKGKKQGKVKLTTANGVQMVNIEDLYYLPPVFTELERQLYKKITSNRDGDYLELTRSYTKRLDGTFCIFGYPYIELGPPPADRDARCNFHKKDYEFLTSKLGLWIFDYTRRHDQQINHKAISGIIIPKGGFVLTDEEREFIENGNWKNFKDDE